MKSLVALLLLFGSSAAQSNRQCYSCSDANCLETYGQVLDCGTTSDSCYTIYKDFIPVKRGCVAQLTVEAEKTACATATDKSCSVCAENNCNTLGHEDHTCLYCSSVSDPKCLTTPEEIGKTRCDAPSIDAPLCYVRAQGSVTERGCLTASANLQECTDDPLCKSCSIASEKSACNIFEYPDGRQKCFKTQTGSSSESLEYCINWDDECVTINDNGVIRKGCESEITAADVKFCANNPNRCRKCGTSECNSDKFELEQTQCRHCSSETDVNCIDNPQVVPVVTCKNGCATTVSSNAQGKLVTKRLCVEELQELEREFCADKNPSVSNFWCRSCGTSNCNSGLFPIDRLACFHCNQSPCASQSAVKSTVCPYYMEEDQCVAIRQGTTVEKLTCKSSLSDTETAFCENGQVEEGRQCTHCLGNHCNDPGVLFKTASCVQCDSLVDKRCASHPEALVATPCKNTAETACYTQSSANVIQRGCLSDLPADEQAVCNDGKTTCVTCLEKAGCNKKLFPANRIKCYQCDSKTDAACHHVGDAFEPEVCETTNASTKCYTIVSETGVVTRKCSIRTPETECGSELYCRACQDSGCNNESPGLVTPTEPDIVRPTLAPDATTTTTKQTTTTATPLTTTTTPSGGVMISVRNGGLLLLSIALLTLHYG